MSDHGKSDPLGSVQAPKVSELPKTPKSALRRRYPAKLGSPRGQHFWVSTYPFFDSTLFLVPDPARDEVTLAQVTIIDSDGTIINEVSVSVSERRCGVLELGQFFGACKIESGMKHGQLLVKAAPGVSPVVQIHSGEQGFVFGECLTLLSSQPTFFPVQFSPDRGSLVAVCNYGEDLGQVRFRLFLGNRTPEISLSVPPRGSRVLSLDAEFADCLDAEKHLHGYIRVSTKSEAGMGVQMIERSVGHKDVPLYMGGA